MKFIGILLVALFLPLTSWAQYSESVVYSFGANASDGSDPLAGLILDSVGNLYGTTEQGGLFNCGTVFKLTQSGVETPLYSFTCGTDGGFPMASLVMDSHGNLFGTSAFYGQYSGGTLFEVNASGVFSVLHQFGTFCSFNGCKGIDGLLPSTPILIDTAGTLYGATQQGGSQNGGCVGQGVVGCGTVFKLTSAGVYSILHNFTSAAGDCETPSWNMLRDGQGNLYGAAFGNTTVGALWQLSPAGQFKIMYSGNNVDSFIARNAAGNFFGGLQGSGVAGGVGTWEVTGGTHKYRNFWFCTTCQGSTAGWEPNGVNVFFNTLMYGTMRHGGAFFNGGGGNDGGGAVYSFNPANGHETVLWSFPNANSGSLDGSYPVSGVIHDSAGNFYGTTTQGGTFGMGTVFKLTAN